MWLFQICQSVSDATREGKLVYSQRNSSVSRAYFASAGKSVSVFVSRQGYSLYTNAVPPKEAAEPRIEYGPEV